MLRRKIRGGKITGPVQNCPALSMVFGEFEVFKSTESEADPLWAPPSELRTNCMGHDRGQQRQLRSTLLNASPRSDRNRLFIWYNSIEGFEFER